MHQSRIMVAAMARKVPRFGTAARRQQAQFRMTLSTGAQAPTDEKGRRHPHLLAHGYEAENLYPDLRGSDGALAFFRDRGIKWWTNARSGDRLQRDGHVGPTRNLSSSQVACVNFLLPLVKIPGALASILRCIDGDVLDIVPIVDQADRKSAVEFEWVGWDAPLEGGRITRGANQTSVDALLVAETRSGRRAYLFEWKYCEEYRYPTDKGLGQSGETRRTRYRPLYERSDSSFKQDIRFDEFLFEPYYQILRLLLLADRMRSSGVTPSLPIHDARVVAVCPAANLEYRQAVRRTPLGRRFPSLNTVEEIVRATMKTPESFAVVAPEDITAMLRVSTMAARLRPWRDYHQLRYGW